MVTVKLPVRPIATSSCLKDKIYVALKEAITSMNLYDGNEDPRLDERQLSEDLGVSRTPLREALVCLEQEGFVYTVPRRGVFVARKTKQQILEVITVWAALESMAARLITLRASDEEIATLRKMFATFENKRVKANIDEYSEANIRFHQAILRIGHCGLICRTTENLFIHVRSIRMKTISEDNRAHQSIIDHMNIIKALERRDTELAERLVREHTLNLAAHVEKNVHYLD